MYENQKKKTYTQNIQPLEANFHKLYLLLFLQNKQQQKKKSK